MFAKITEGKNRAIARSLPLSAEDAVKVSFGAAVPKSAPKPVVAPRAAVLGIAEDEEEGKKKRELVPLDYSDDEDEKERKKKARAKPLSAGERERKAREIKDDVPTTKEALWKYKVSWAVLSEVRPRSLYPLFLAAARADGGRGVLERVPVRWQ